MGHVILDADGEAIPVLRGVEEVVDRLDVLGLGVLGGKAITSAEDLDVSPAFGGEGDEDVLIERLALGTEFFGAVEDGDLLDGGRDDLHEALGGERTIEVDFDQADLLAALIEFFDDFAGGLGDRAHGDDDLGRVGGADVDEGGVFTAGEPGGFGEILFGGGVDVVDFDVLRFAALEIDVVVLGTAAGHGVGVRVESAGTELFDFVHREELLPFVLIDEFDVLDLVGGTETVEEMADGDGGLDRDEVGDRGKVGDLLDRVGADHRDAGLTDGIDVLMVAEDGKGAGREGTGGDMEDRREQLAAPLIDVRDHEQ